MPPIRVRWSAGAAEDLQDIHDYIARQSPRYAAVVAGRLVATVDRVREFPESGRIVPELGEPEVREVIHGAYRIVYELFPDVAVVLGHSRCWTDRGPHRTWRHNVSLQVTARQASG